MCRRDAGHTCHVEVKESLRLANAEMFSPRNPKIPVCREFSSVGSSPSLYFVRHRPLPEVFPVR